MFQFFSDLLFPAIKPFAVRVLKKNGYPADAVARKCANIAENGFSKDDKVIMFHGVSVGEINALENLIKKARKEFSDCKIAVTTGTYTGQDVAKKKLSEYTDLITYFPADFPKIVRKFLDKVNPDIVLIAETEIWPNFAIECKRRGIKLYIINGRISDRTFKSYEMFRFIFKPLLNLYSGVFTQSDEDNKKFLRLGSNPDTTKRMNNLKFDIAKPELNIEFDKGTSRVLLAGSTHQGEDEIVLNTYKTLKSSHPDLKLILAPRHLTRIDEVKQLTEDSGFTYELRSNGKKDLQDIDVLLLDTLGELGKMYAFSDISFIGGSFSSTGGHNPLESIVFDVPVISGPSVNNFKDIYSIITNAHAGFVVKTETEFAEIADKMLSDKEFYQAAVNASKQVFADQQGALDFVLNIIKNSFTI